MMQRNVDLAANCHFDLVVIGGGIYGAWTAYDAALRGLKVALLEQGDWASATSSASSKLIHGGLRYLEALEISLVHKTLAERQMFLDTAPHRVWPLRFGVPVYSDSRIGRIRLKAGLILYDLLAGTLKIKQPHRYFNSKQFSERFDFLKTEGLSGGFTYSDAQTDDARLVLELIDGAQQAGAICLNYCQVSEAAHSNGHSIELKIKDKIGNNSASVFTNQCVYTTGQWLRNSGEKQSNYRLSKGVHLVLPKLPDKEALLLTTGSDGRVFFMIPWYGLTLLGTTDTGYTGDINRVTIEQQDINYLLNASNAYLKTVKWKENDIIGMFAGLRVLQEGTKKSPSSLSRDWQLHSSGHGIYYSIGGKITSAREDASHIVDTVCKYSVLDTPCPTKNRWFPWAPRQDWTEWSEGKMSRAKRLNIDQESALWLLRRHGNRVNSIFQMVTDNPDLSDRILPSLPFIKADLLFCAEFEMVVHLDDLLRRRLPLLILTTMTFETIKSLAEFIAEIVGWDEHQILKETEQCCRKWLL